MNKLTAVELKAFIPSKDFNLSKQFFSCLGFTKSSDTGGIAYFHLGNCSFLLQDFYDRSLASNLMMHLLIEDVYAWHNLALSSDIAGKYEVSISSIVEQA